MKYIRKGKCQPKKCMNACCKNFGEPVAPLKEVDGCCVWLKANKCSRQKNKPKVCLNFPVSPFDGMYERIKDKCGFYFVKEEL